MYISSNAEFLAGEFDKVISALYRNKGRTDEEKTHRPALHGPQIFFDGH